jgi:mono/diheme cytochrome c family protein
VRVWVIAAGLVATVIAVTACGSSGSAKPTDLTRGRELFLSGTKGQLSCGFCHSLRAAAATGPFAPDLDIIWSQEPKGFTRSAFRQMVLEQIAHPLCLDEHDPSRCMPMNIVAGADAADVAVYVANCVGRSGTPGCEPSPGGLRGEAGVGEHLYATLGCVTCHWTNGKVAIAPSFGHLYGSKVQLANGKTVVADDTYLMSSILLPDKDIVKGFEPGFMSGRIKPGQVTDAQAKALIAYIKTLK